MENTVKLPRWQQLPDVDLYKDQVVSQINKYLSSLPLEEEKLTPSMVNNYVKWKMIPAPKKKLYGRSHLSQLLLLTLLKPILPLQDIQTAYAYLESLKGEEEAYNTFCEQFEQVAKQFQDNSMEPFQAASYALFVRNQVRNTIAQEKTLIAHEEDK